ncbi:MAG: biotin--[acetyl-CoA-carboxylase] ligase [Oscillospiraceae bacterium]|nr:biotin--[acetyl-CoA-carboxylase] ligase [Oscillospiraceae bacterium]
MLAEIQKYLSMHPWRDTIEYFECIDSTNTYAKKMAMQGAAEGTVIIAGQQTGGRGRLGRSFSSPAGMGIYLSVILRPGCRPEELMHLTCATGVAAAKAIGRPATGIKWTNDLVLGKRKLGGILTELSVDPTKGIVDWAVVGIGINCCQKPWQFPEEIRDMACSLGMDWQDVPWLIADLIIALQQMRQELFTGKAEIMAQFRRRCVTIGSEISILRGENVMHARAIGVDDAGGLQVVYSDGKQETVTSGEVSIRGMYGYL